jgi:hypothetical protein
MLPSILVVQAHSARPSNPLVGFGVSCVAEMRMSESGTNRTNRAGLMMSVLEGKADFPVAHPDFSV